MCILCLYCLYFLLFLSLSWFWNRRFKRACIGNSLLQSHLSQQGNTSSPTGSDGGRKLVSLVSQKRTTCQEWDKSWKDTLRLIRPYQEADVGVCTCSKGSMFLPIHISKSRVSKLKWGSSISKSQAVMWTAGVNAAKVFKTKHTRGDVAGDAVKVTLFVFRYPTWTKSGPVTFNCSWLSDGLLCVSHWGSHSKWGCLWFLPGRKVPFVPETPGTWVMWVEI